LASEQQASIRDIAGILHHSYWQVSRLQADRPVDLHRLHKCLGWIRPLRVERWAIRSVHTVEIAGRQARIIATDVVGEAKRAAVAKARR
jgi:hypothetical protein